MNYWLVIGINARTMKREVVGQSNWLETARMHKLDLENEKPRRYCGVTIEYGDKEQWEQTEEVQE
jgi:hypothetical protein